MKTNKQVKHATIGRLLPQSAITHAQIKPIVADVMYAVEPNIAGNIIAESIAYGM